LKYKEIQGNKLRPVEQKNFSLEKELQSLIEENLEVILRTLMDAENEPTIRARNACHLKYNCRFFLLLVMRGVKRLNIFPYFVDWIAFYSGFSLCGG